MIRTAILLVRAGLRTEPGRTVAVALLLATGVLLPTLIAGQGWVGVLPAAVLAWAASAGATTHHERAARILILNGSGPGVPALAAAGAMVLPGAAATLAILAAGPFLSGGIDVAIAIGIGLVVPVLAATAQSLLGGPRRLRATNRWVRLLGALLVVPLLLAAPILIVPVVLYFVVPRWQGGWRRTTVTLGAAMLAAAIAVGVGHSGSWFDLSFALLVVWIPLLLVLFRLGSSGVDLVSALGPHLGARARLATAPLRQRRRAVVPLAMALGLMASLAVMDAVVGASFGQREDQRDAAAPEVVGRPALRPDQVVIRVTQSDPATVARVTAEEAAGTQVRAAVIDRLGGGATSSTNGGFLAGTAEVSIQGVGRGPDWIGVVAPEGMAPLGLADQAPALARGEAVVLNPAGRPGDGAIDIAFDGRTVPLPAVTRPGTTVATEMPGALVSPGVADLLGIDVTASRVVLSPPAGAQVPFQSLEPFALAIRNRAVPDASVGTSTTEEGQDGQDLLTTFSGLLEAGEEAANPILYGDEVEYADPGGALNEVPGFSGTREAGTRSLLVIGPICLVLLVASVVLILGATRYEDAVLSENGATPRLRASLAAAQAGMLALGTSLVGAVAGIGLPALAFRTYNHGGDRGALPIIPLAVPWAVPVGLLVFTTLAVISAGLIVVARDQLSSVHRDDLAW